MERHERKVNKDKLSSYLLSKKIFEVNLELPIFKLSKRVIRCNSYPYSL
jgi:hypothetical protein